MQTVYEVQQQVQSMIECAKERQLTRAEILQLLDICIFLLKDLQETMESIYSQ